MRELTLLIMSIVVDIMAVAILALPFVAEHGVKGVKKRWWKITDGDRRMWIMLYLLALIMLAVTVVCYCHL